MKSPIAKGLLGTLALLALYFGAVTLISGWEFAKSQFASFWYFIVPLAVGFGVQVGLYAHLRNLVRGTAQGRGVIAATGTTSGVAMLSCCAHYLVNILPILGATGIVTLASQYQVELFWVGLAANAGGIAYIARRIKSISTPA